MIGLVYSNYILNLESSLFCIFLRHVMVGQSIQCDFCGKVDQSFEAKNINMLRIDLTANKGWYFMKIDRVLHDFCGEDCCQKWLLKNRRLANAS